MNDKNNYDDKSYAKTHTSLVIDANEVDPEKVDVHIMAKESSVPMLPFTMKICCVALHHELKEAGLKLDLHNLCEFVAEDLSDHEQIALSAYLNIIRGILNSNPPKRKFGINIKPGKTRNSIWTLVKVKNVVQSGESILLQGISLKN